MATIDYAKQYSGKIDEKFKEGAKTDSLVNKEFDFVGAKTVSVQTVSTATMNDYQRTGSNRYGDIEELDVTSQEMTMTKDRSFTFAIDKMDSDETKRALEAGKALARQLREVVIPEIDAYRFSKLVEGAGTTETGALTKANIYDAITTATAVLDEAEVPEGGRVLVVNPATYKLIKDSTDFVLDTEIGQDMRIKGYVAELDGMPVLKVPANRLGSDVNFIITHAMACCSPVKLAEYKIHTDAPGISGELVEGRVYYDAFVLNNKKKAIYAHKNA